MSSASRQAIELSQAPMYQIRIKGHLYDFWADTFGGLTISLEEDGDTVLSGRLVDDAALFGLLKKVRDLGLQLVSINRVEPGKEDVPNE